MVEGGSGSRCWYRGGLIDDQRYFGLGKALSSPVARVSYVSDDDVKAYYTCPRRIRIRSLAAALWIRCDGDAAWKNRGKRLRYPLGRGSCRRASTMDAVDVAATDCSQTLTIEKMSTASPET